MNESPGGHNPSKYTEQVCGAYKKHFVSQTRVYTALARNSEHACVSWRKRKDSPLPPFKISFPPIWSGKKLRIQVPGVARLAGGQCGQWSGATGLSFLISGGIEGASARFSTPRLQPVPRVVSSFLEFCSSQLLPQDTQEWVEWFGCPGCVLSCNLPK